MEFYVKIQTNLNFYASTTIDNEILRFFRNFLAVIPLFEVISDLSYCVPVK